MFENYSLVEFLWELALLIVATLAAYQIGYETGESAGWNRCADEVTSFIKRVHGSPARLN